MPCHTVSTAKVRLNAATIDKALLSKAMTSLGIYAYAVNPDGTLTVSGSRVGSDVAAQVNRAYSRQVVTAQAKRFGWAVKEQPDGKLLIQKATF